MKKIIMVIISSLLLVTARAQVHYTLEAGYALTANYASYIALREPFNGAQISFAVDYRFGAVPFLGIKGGIGYRFIGYYSETRRIFTKTAPPDATTMEYLYDHSVFIPARLTFNFDVNDWTLRVLTGPNVSFHVGQYYYEAESKSEATNYSGRTDLGYVYFPLDCAWGIGFGTAYRHLYLETGLDLGLYNRTRRQHYAYANHTYSSREFHFTVGYIF